MHVGVYGLGRFGSLWATLLSQNFRVSAYNRSPRPTPDGTTLVEEEQLSECDIVFLCVAIRAIEPVSRRLATILKPGTIVADTCSVKVYPLECMKRALGEHFPVLGTHPMFGPDSVGDPDHILPVVLTPGYTADGEGQAREGSRRSPAFDENRLLNTWTRHFSDLGMRVERMSAEAHDREAARTQGITHLVGRILEELDLPDSAIATTGYRRLQQLVEQTCNDPYELFEDLWKLNPHAAEARESFERSVRSVLGRLDAAGERVEGRG